MVGLRPGPDGQTVNWLQKSVNHGWDGDLLSGYRSPEYSTGLCYDMCGAPTCTYCAGAGSNHAQTGPPNWGAIDVENPWQFGPIQRKIGSPLKNALSGDLWHYSFTGR